MLLYRLIMDQNQKNIIRKKGCLRILIVFKLYSEPENLALVKRVITSFLSQIQTVFYFVEDSICQKVTEVSAQALTVVFNKKLHANVIDYVFTIGGDGTILYAAKQFESVAPPFLTIQKGTLGFLCKFRPDDIEDIVHRIVENPKPVEWGKNNHVGSKFGQNHEQQRKNQFEMSKLMRLTSTVSSSFGNELKVIHTKIVLNEVAITRKDNNRISLQIFIDGEPVTTTSGDGILVSTPTGSTAYALSAGGPVVLNGVNTILLVPIAPNSLSFRPICIPSSSVVKVKLSNKSKSDALVSFDGQSNIEITQEDEICIWYEGGEKNRDLILYQPKMMSLAKSEVLPTWMQRLKLFLGWNEVFKSPACEILSKNLDKIQ